LVTLIAKLTITQPPQENFYKGMKNVPKLSFFLAFTAIILLLNLFLVSCKKDLNSSIVTNEQAVHELDLKSYVSFENGVLAFKDWDATKKVIDYLGNQATAPQNVLPEVFPGFVSLEAAFESVSRMAAEGDIDPKLYNGIAYWSGEGDDMSFERIIESPFYAMICDQSSHFKVGENWIKHTKDEIIIYPAEYGNISLRNSVEPLNRIRINNIIGERDAAECETVYAWDNGYQWKKVFGRRTDYYTLPGPTFTGEHWIESMSRKRGFLGRWYAYDATVGINGIGSNSNVSSYSRKGGPGNSCFVISGGLTGTCSTF
jgi:hypothetical protein